MIYTEKEISHLRAAAQHFKLDAPREFWFKPAAELAAVFENWENFGNL